MQADQTYQTRPNKTRQDQASRPGPDERGCLHSSGLDRCLLLGATVPWAVRKVGVGWMCSIWHCTVLYECCSSQAWHEQRVGLSPLLGHLINCTCHHHPSASASAAEQRRRHVLRVGVWRVRDRTNTVICNEYVLEYRRLVKEGLVNRGQQ